MEREPKAISRSIRMTETVYAYVNSHVGEGFNQKFENLCMYFMREEKTVQKRIKEKQMLLDSLNTRIQSAQAGLKAIEDIQWQLDRAKNEVARITEKCNSFSIPESAPADKL